MGSKPFKLLLPFPPDAQLCPDFTNLSSNIHNAILPDRPNLCLADGRKLVEYLRSELCCTELDSISRRLWTLSTPLSDNITPLHKHQVFGRSVCLVEEPRLHLTWIDGRVMVKPLPRHLLSFDFWHDIISNASAMPLGISQREIHRSALGFLRTYHYMIQHESDLVVAQEHRLLPSDITWSQFLTFSNAIKDSITDRDVSGRYHYGEIRLSRLNLYAPFLLGTWNYQRVHGQFKDRFGRFFAPLLFTFALLATILSGMQVALTGPPSSDCGTTQSTSSAPCETSSLNAASKLWPFFAWFSVITTFISILVGVVIALIWAYTIVREWTFSFKTWRRRQKLLDRSA